MRPLVCFCIIDSFREVSPGPASIYACMMRVERANRVGPDRIGRLRSGRLCGGMGAQDMSTPRRRSMAQRGVGVYIARIGTLWASVNTTNRRPETTTPNPYSQRIRPRFTIIFTGDVQEVQYGALRSLRIRFQLMAFLLRSHFRTASKKTMT